VAFLDGGGGGLDEAEQDLCTQPPAKSIFPTPTSNRKTLLQHLGSPHLVEDGTLVSKRGMPPQRSDGRNPKYRCLGGEFRGSKLVGFRCCVATCDIFNLVVGDGLPPPPRAGRRLCCGQGRMMGGGDEMSFSLIFAPEPERANKPKKFVRLISSEMSIESTLFKTPAELLESSIYNSFSRRRRWAWLW
jgi:hypothetical protein